jgi:hypothetical protein
VAGSSGAAATLCCSGIEHFGVCCRCLGLDKLIEVKRAVGRPKDLEALAELEAIREERGEDG